MEFKSAKPGFSIVLFRNDQDDPYSAFTLRVEGRTAFGNFVGENNGLQFSAFPNFIKRFKEFIDTRQGEAKLDLTEDSELSFFRWNSKGDVGIRFKISRYAYFGDSMRTCPLTLTGAFPLDSEYINQIYLELIQLVNA